MYIIMREIERGRGAHSRPMEVGSSAYKGCGLGAQGCCLDCARVGAAVGFEGRPSRWGHRWMAPRRRSRTREGDVAVMDLVVLREEPGFVGATKGGRGGLRGWVTCVAGEGSRGAAMLLRAGWPTKDE